jgi:hypothetical protein
MNSTKETEMILPSTIRKIEKLKLEFQSFDSFETQAEKLNYLRENPLRFYAYYVALLKDAGAEGFVEELELDACGEVKVLGKQITNYVGDIKSGTNDKDCIIQLVRRLGILYLAEKHSLPAPMDYTFCAIGELYGTDEWIDADPSLVESAKIEAGLTEYPDLLEIESNPLIFCD